MKEELNYLEGRYFARCFQFVKDKDKDKDNDKV